MITVEQNLTLVDVILLLGQSNLPVSDLTTEKMTHFFFLSIE
jgi:hypothetical protein